MGKFKMTSRNFCGIPLFAFYLISAASMAGLLDPVWRGREKTVYAKWENWAYQTDASGNFFFDPDVKNFGEGVMSSVIPQAVQWAAQVTGPPIQVLGSYDSHLNVLKLNKPGLYVNLPNFLEGEYVLLQFEICYYSEYADYSGFIVTGLTQDGILPGYNETFILPQLIDSRENGQWITEVYQFTITPNPLWENIVITFDHYPDTPQALDAPYIDYFSFDTICVPEPASMVLLALGAFLIRRK